MPERIMRPVPQALQINTPLLGAPFTLTGEESIFVTVYNSVFNAAVTVAIRYQAPGETHIGTITQTIAPSFDRFPNRRTIPIGAATVYNVSVRPSGLILYPGQLYIRIEIARGDGAQIPVATLIAGYVGSWSGLSWPGTPQVGPWDGPGAMINTTIGPAALGAATLDMAQAPLTRWRIHSVRGIFTTGAGVGNRIPQLLLTELGTRVWMSPANLIMTAGQNLGYWWGAGCGVVTDPTGQLGQGAIPHNFDLVSTLAPNALQLQLGFNLAGDQINEMSVHYEEWMAPVTI